MVAPPRGLLPVVLALLVLATGPARAATECDLCTQAVDELRGGQVSGCGTPGTNPDFAVCSRTVQTLLVNTHRVTSLLWEGCMVTDEQETPKKEVPCPSNDICAAVLPGSCTPAQDVHAEHTPTPGPAFSVEGALHTYHSPASRGRTSLLDPAPRMETFDESASPMSGFPSPAYSSSLPGRVYKKFVRAKVQEAGE